MEGLYVCFLVPGKAPRVFKGRKRDIYRSIVSQSIADVLVGLRKTRFASILLPNPPALSLWTNLRAVNINNLEGFSAPGPWSSGLENRGVRRHDIVRDSPRVGKAPGGCQNNKSFVCW